MYIYMHIYIFTWYIRGIFTANWVIILTTDPTFTFFNREFPIESTAFDPGFGIEKLPFNSKSLLWNVLSG